MINGINPNKVEEIRETMYRNAVTMFLHTLDGASKLGLVISNSISSGVSSNV